MRLRWVGGIRSQASSGRDHRMEPARKGGGLGSPRDVGKPARSRSLHRTGRRLLRASCVFLLASCASSPRPSPPPTAREPGAPYLIKAGDYLDVRFYKTPELNVEVTVRPDGKISLEIVGDIQAAGLQPRELAGALTERYAGELAHPRVSVIVRAFGGQVYVEGEVRTPSAPPFAMGITALQAISLAGGFLDTAQPNSVILIRLEDGQYHGYRLALNDARTGRDIAQDVHLQPADILHVPRSRVADVNLFVEQYIRRNLPVTPAIPIF